MAAASDDWIMLLRMCWRKQHRHSATSDATKLLQLYSSELIGRWKELQTKLESEAGTADDVMKFFAEEWQKSGRVRP